MRCNVTLRDVTLNKSLKWAARGTLFLVTSKSNQLKIRMSGLLKEPFNELKYHIHYWSKV